MACEVSGSEMDGRWRAMTPPGGKESLEANGFGAATTVRGVESWLRDPAAVASQRWVASRLRALGRQMCAPISPRCQPGPALEGAVKGAGLGKAQPVGNFDQGEFGL